MRDHALLMPSSAARWVGQCPASARLEAQYTDEPSPASLEGDAAHDVARSMLMGTPIRLGSTATNGAIVTEDMIEAAEMYVDDVIQISSDCFVEQQVGPCPDMPDLWGTPDAWWYDNDADTLFIWDFKFGHAFVDAFENWQLITYAYLIIRMSTKNYMPPDLKTRVVLTIVQPRSYHPVGPIRRWETDVVELAAYFKRLTDSVTAAMSNGAQTSVGPECKYCKARHTCEALMLSSQSAMDVAAGPVAIDLPPAALGLELRNLMRAESLLSARITGLEAEATGLIRRGEPVPFFTLEQLNGREVWTKSVDELIALGMLLEVDLVKPPTPITPNQARKLGVDPELIASYTDRPKGALKLVAQDDTSARRIFSKKGR